MRVLLLNGDPHEFGCTYTALREAADALERRVSKPRFFKNKRESMEKEDDATPKYRNVRLICVSFTGLLSRDTVYRGRRFGLSNRTP